MGRAPGSGRDESLDAVRGLAVLMMVWVHFVPDDGPWTEVWAFDALPAALFTMLVGVSSAAGGTRPWWPVLRRAGALAVIGLPFWVWVWGNDILIPIACMVLLSALLRFRAGATWAVLGCLLLAVPIATELWGDYAWSEVRQDGTHEANHSWGWHTVRYFLLHGAYPLVPWAVFPLLGLRFAAARGSTRALLGWLLGGAAALAAGLALDRYGDAAGEGLPVHLDITWQPTSLPFVMVWGGASCALLSLVYLAGLRVRALAVVGRWSLQHYLAHLVLVFWPMTLWWPDEDWPWSVGVAAAGGYLVAALAVAACAGGRTSRS